MMKQIKSVSHYLQVASRRLDETLKQLYRPIQQRYATPPTPKKWVFITGCYNSGTTLLHKILKADERFGTLPNEGIFYTNQLPRPQHLGYRRLWALAPDLFEMNEEGEYPISAESIKKDWAPWFNNPDAEILVEKSPPTAGRMRWFQRHFKNAHFICIVRNGYAVAEGIHRKVGHSLVKTATQWNVSNEIMLEHIKHLDNVLLIRYEDLTENPRSIVRDIYAFIGVEMPVNDFETKAISVHEQQSTIKNMNERSFERLTPNDISIIEREAKKMLLHFGYFPKS
ncbi:hypothetical protein CEQ90_06730 [Lewinellaceae bacterium SD302]|nr:hypothetical protein CEQ90_06730 [Lewinellaceae bacterium SD302]